MNARPTVFVINPRSAGGATGRRLPDLRKAADECFSDYQILETTAPGHATELAAVAIAQGAGTVVAVGGDGTANEVVNGFFDGAKPRSEEVVFGIVPAGTGSDLIKTLRVPKEIHEAMRIVARGEVRKSDAVLVRYTTPGGDAAQRIGINVVGIGMSGDVVRRANQSSKRLGGRITFAAATLRSILSFRPPRVSLKWSGAEDGSWEGKLATLFLANGQYCGGGMWVGRNASMADGLLDATLVPDLPLTKQLVASPRLFLGTAAEVEGVRAIRLSRLAAEALEGDPVLIDIDGEQPGMLPANVEVLPKTVNVCGVWR